METIKEEAIEISEGYVMDSKTEENFNIVCEALKRVEKGYYKLETIYKPEGIVRERVFCYELYHNIRCLQQKEGKDRLIVNAEVDKLGNLCSTGQGKRLNPDFVFHIPGENEGNTIVIEVKGNINITGCKNDFRKLVTFVKEKEYKVGVFILYNHSLKEFSKRMKEKLKAMEIFEETINDKILILCKKDKDTDIEKSTIAKLFSEPCG